MGACQPSQKTVPSRSSIETKTIGGYRCKTGGAKEVSKPDLVWAKDAISRDRSCLV